MSCSHEDFKALVKVNRLQDTGQFQADITIVCAQCNEPFRFLGLPAGLNMNGAAVSLDGLEARMAIAPASRTLSPIAGFEKFTIHTDS